MRAWAVVTAGTCSAYGGIHGEAMGIAMGALRFSLSRYTTEREIDRAADIVCETVPRLRHAVASAP